MSGERIISGDEVFVPQALDLPEDWEGAFVFDPNSVNIPNRHPSEDVIAWLVTKWGALLMDLDGVSKGKPGSPSANYDSGPVTLRFAQEALAYARPYLESQTSFELWQMHQHAGSRIQSAHQSEEELPEGGLVGISTLLLPDGHVRMHRFGDTEPALSTDPQNPERLEVPEALWPENRASDIYKKQAAAVAAGQSQWDAVQSKGLWRRHALTPPAGFQNVTRHASTSRGLRFIDEDYHIQLPKEGSILKGSDGLRIYSNLELIQNSTRLPILELLRKVYIFGKSESDDNISGFGVRRKN